MVMGVLVGTATVATQGLTGLLRHDETKSGDFYLAKTGDFQLATSGDFFMATDTGSSLVIAACELELPLAQAAAISSMGKIRAVGDVT